MSASSDIITTTPDTDQALAGRFYGRVLALTRFVIPLHIVAILVMAPFGSTVISHFAHLLMAIVAYWMAYRTRDAIKFIIFSHVYWTFSVLTYLFAILHLQQVDFGLGNADRAALIALTSQAALLLAFLLSPEGDPLRRVTTEQKAVRLGTARLLVIPFLAIGMVGILGDITGALPQAVTAELQLLFYFGLAIQVSRADIPFLNPVTLGATFAFAFAAIASNERSALFGVLLFLFFAALVHMRRVLTLGKLVLVYFGLKLMTVFSAVALSVRWARDAGTDILALFNQSFFSMETVWTLLNPLHVHEAEIVYTSRLGQTGFYSEFIGRTTDILSRLAALPQMDIVTRQLDPNNPQYGGEFWPIILSALPSFGQSKQLLFSDVIVWNLGLRSPGSIGRPMITAEGELFAIGGYPTVFVVIGICFYVMHLLYRSLTRMLGSRTAMIILFSQYMVYTMLSTTLLSLVVGTTRGPLQNMLVLAVGSIILTLAFGRSLRSRPASGPQLA